MFFFLVFFNFKGCWGPVAKPHNPSRTKKRDVESLKISGSFVQTEKKEPGNNSWEEEIFIFEKYLIWGVQIKHFWLRKGVKWFGDRANLILRLIGDFWWIIVGGDSSVRIGEPCLEVFWISFRQMYDYFAFLNVILNFYMSSL